MTASSIRSPRVPRRRRRPDREGCATRGSCRSRPAESTRLRRERCPWWPPAAIRSCRRRAASASLRSRAARPVPPESRTPPAAPGSPGRSRPTPTRAGTCPPARPALSGRRMRPAGAPPPSVAGRWHERGRSVSSRRGMKDSGRRGRFRGRADTAPRAVGVTHTPFDVDGRRRLTPKLGRVPVPPCRLQRLVRPRGRSRAEPWAAASASTIRQAPPHGNSPREHPPFRSAPITCSHRTSAARALERAR